MTYKRILTIAAIALMPLCAGAASLVVPAAGTGPGANNSHWQTELTLHNASARALNISLYFHDASGRSAAVPVTLGARATTSIADIVKSRFGRDSATGAIEIEVAAADLTKLAVTSRTFNRSAAGEYGQDVPAINVANAAGAGDVSVLAGPSSATAFRFNFGVYAVSDSTVTWELIRADGTIAATREVSYAAGTQTQHNLGISTLLNATPQDNDSLHATLVKGSAMFYGSAVNQATGDPAYVSSVRTRPDVRINFLGVDLDENGTVDLVDADHDGVLDGSIEVFTANFPSYFRVLAQGEAGEIVTFTIVSTPSDTLMIDDNGTFMMAATSAVRNTKGDLRVLATAGSTSAVLVIPVQFR